MKARLDYLLERFGKLILAALSSELRWRILDTFEIGGLALIGKNNNLRTSSKAHEPAFLGSEGRGLE